MAGSQGRNVYWAIVITDWRPKEYWYSAKTQCTQACIYFFVWKRPILLFLKSWLDESSKALYNCILTRIGHCWYKGDWIMASKNLTRLNPLSTVFKSLDCLPFQIPRIPIHIFANYRKDYHMVSIFILARDLSENLRNSFQNIMLLLREVRDKPYCRQNLPSNPNSTPQNQRPENSPVWWYSLCWAKGWAILQAYHGHPHYPFHFLYFHSGVAQIVVTMPHSSQERPAQFGISHHTIGLQQWILYAHDLLLILKNMFKAPKTAK